MYLYAFMLGRNDLREMGKMTLKSLREALKKTHGYSEFGPTPLNPPSPTSDRGKNVGIVVSKFRPPHPLRR